MNSYNLLPEEFPLYLHLDGGIFLFLLENETVLCLAMGRTRTIETNLVKAWFVV